MFGGLRIERGRLDDAQTEFYRAHFCAACHATRHEFGRLETLGTNYEQTVLCLVAAGVAGTAQVQRAPCTALPLRQVGVVALDPKLRRYLAALNLAVIEQKLIDDQQDEDGRWWTGGLRWLLRGRFGRSRQRLGELGFPLESLVGLAAAQLAVEARPGLSLGEYARPSAALSAEIFGFVAELSGREELREDLIEVGRQLGYLVYALDALRDLDEDLRRGSFNPLPQRPRPSWELREELEASVDVLAARLEALPLGPQAAVLGALLDSLRHQLVHQAPGRRAEAGECDLCSGVDCCAGESCCGGGGGGGGCGCADNACSCCDCCFTGAARDRRRERRRQRRERVALD